MLRPSMPPGLPAPAHTLTVSAHPHAVHESALFSGLDVALLCIWGLYMLVLVHAALCEPR